MIDRENVYRVDGNVGTGVDFPTAKLDVAGVIQQSALFSNETGEMNVANGFTALNSNTYGNNNIAMGGQALLSNTEGSKNIAIGTEALAMNTDRDELVAIGYQALSQNGIDASEITHAKYNTATGVEALKENITVLQIQPLATLA